MIAFGWYSIIVKRHAVTLTSNSAPTVSRSTDSASALLSKPRSTVMTEITSITQLSPAIQGNVSAQLQPDALPALQTAQTQTIVPGCDIILLIDSSGSMKQSDPGDYRKNAAKLFISLLDKNDRIGVIGFGKSTTLLKPLTQNTRQNRQAFFDAVDKITSKELFTNITEAVLQGLKELEISHRRNRIMILMSDGRIDLGSREKDDASQSVLMGILSELARKQIPLYTIAFTQKSDRALLENMAKETGGLFRFAGEDKDVHVIFASIFEKIKSPDAIPFVGESFTIDREIREATVLVTKKPGSALSLIDPSGKQHMATAHDAHIAWFESSIFNMITIQYPAAGIWNLKLSMNEGNKVYVITSLHLKSSFGGHDLVEGQTATIDAWLEKSGGAVLERPILENTTFSAAITGPDGKTSTVDLSRTVKPGELRNENDVFFGTIPALSPGQYTVNIVATGKTFQRQMTVFFKVISSADKPAIRQSLVQSIQATAREEFSWLSVMAKFGIINLAVIGIAAALFGMRIMIKKMRSRR
ncbi:MAG TPA: vWA domain-containing protein [Nitrospirota bacterium]|nr:vWA domain-containing protein [Nitrospirota bacterium]